MLLLRLLWFWSVFVLNPTETAHLASGMLATAPTYLTPERALEHAFAVEVSGHVYGIEPELLASIGFHESRYSPTERTPELGGKVSCGAMTPEPKARCSSADLTVLGGYLAGAAHLRGWLDATHGYERLALLGYAGGGALIRICVADPDRRACQTPDVFLSRAAWIVRAGRPST